MKCQKVYKGREGFDKLKSKGFARSIRNITGSPLFFSSKAHICDIANKNKGKVQILEFSDGNYTLLGKNTLPTKFELKQ